LLELLLRDLRGLLLRERGRGPCGRYQCRERGVSLDHREAGGSKHFKLLA
jgi:hypothetical protein